MEKNHSSTALPRGPRVLAVEQREVLPPTTAARKVTGTLLTKAGHITRASGTLTSGGAERGITINYRCT